MGKSLNRRITPWSLLSFAAPSIIMMVFMSLYTIVDGIFVSRFVGSNALSSLNIVYPVVNVAIAIAMMLASGGNAIISKYLGEGNKKRACESLTQFVMVCILVSLVIVVISQVFLTEISRLLGSNEVLLAREGQKILGMIHLNPYHIRTGKKTYTLNYIVAVAVWKEYRRQGIMAAMLTKCLNDMHQKRQPFTYLMPANKAYYEPFQFTFVMDWEETMIHSMNDSDKIIPAIQQDARIVTAPEEEYDRITIFLEQFMQPYQIYTIPDKQYLRRLSKESQSGEGNLMVYYEGEQLTGVFAESFEDDEVYIRWAYSTQPENMLNEIKYRYKNKKIYITEGNLTKGEKIPKIMARITDLTAWGEILHGKSDFTFRILVKDPYIKDQNGVYQFQCLNHKISIQCVDSSKENACKEGRSDAQEWEDEISIDELTQVFFDNNAGQILKQHEYLKDIVPAGPIYISEEV
mgnify:FL=1